MKKNLLVVAITSFIAQGAFAATSAADYQVASQSLADRNALVSDANSDGKLTFNFSAPFTTPSQLELAASDTVRVRFELSAGLFGGASAPKLGFKEALLSAPGTPTTGGPISHVKGGIGTNYVEYDLKPSAASQIVLTDDLSLSPMTVLLDEESEEKSISITYSSESDDVTDVSGNLVTILDGTGNDIIGTAAKAEANSASSFVGFTNANGESVTSATVGNLKIGEIILADLKAQNGTVVFFSS